MILLVGGVSVGKEWTMVMLKIMTYLDVLFINNVCGWKASND